MTSVYEITDQFIEDYADFDPTAATFIGLPGRDGKTTDYSPEGIEARTELSRRTLRALEACEVASNSERICRTVAMSQIRDGLELADAGEHFASLNILNSPMQSVRMVFDLMPKNSPEEWENVASRMEGLHGALNGYQQTLDEGIRSGRTASIRQVRKCAVQADTWHNKGDSFFHKLLKENTEAAKGSALMQRLNKAADSASAACEAFACYLRNQYAPNAREEDAFGAERYALQAKGFNGIDLDLEDTYEWGWGELRRIRTRMLETAHEIKRGASLTEVVELLETDAARVIDGVEPFRQWMQDLQDKTIDELDGVHFDIPEPVKRIEALIAPPGGALAMYYTGPSEDFSRPGRTWYPTNGKEKFPIWREVSIAYHEGTPGHHFQVATTVANREKLSRFQRLFAGTSGYVEGWALYAERLMEELGYLRNPDYLLGMLDAQALRSARVVLDIGMHLGLAIPKDESFHPGETWTPELGLEFMTNEVHFPPDFTASEVDRYLGLPGQAISYKVGERVWLEARAAAKAKIGTKFDLKEWHNKALDLGPMGLEQLRQEMGI